jgi:hypothetical protein
MKTEGKPRQRSVKLPAGVNTQLNVDISIYYRVSDVKTHSLVNLDYGMRIKRNKFLWSSSSHSTNGAAKCW